MCWAHCHWLSHEVTWHSCGHFEDQNRIYSNLLIEKQRIQSKSYLVQIVSNSCSGFSWPKPRRTTRGPRSRKGRVPRLTRRKRSQKNQQRNRSLNPKASRSLVGRLSDKDPAVTTNTNCDNLYLCNWCFVLLFEFNNSIIQILGSETWVKSLRELRGIATILVCCFVPSRVCKAPLVTLEVKRNDCIYFVWICWTIFTIYQPCVLYVPLISCWSGKPLL